MIRIYSHGNSEKRVKVLKCVGQTSERHRSLYQQQVFFLLYETIYWAYFSYCGKSSLAEVANHFEILHPHLCGGECLLKGMSPDLRQTTMFW